MRGVFKVLEYIYFTYRYINDVLSLNDSNFSEFIALSTHMDTNESSSSASHFYYFLYIDNRRLYDKRDDFSFPIFNFPFFELQYSLVTYIRSLCLSVSPFRCARVFFNY